ncbi:MAG: UPF0182 family protein, partial [Armatimonadetes bacterium]|nr:UPF0182 family protein [Armatimonadota bacterium]
MSRSNKWLLWLFGALAAFITILKLLSLYADYCWFQALGQAAVFSTILWTRVELGVVIGGAFFLWLWLNARLARRPLPSDIVLIGRRLLTEEEREQVEQYLDKALLAFCVIGGLMLGFVASGHWLDWLHFRNPVPFGYSDPLFHRDASFYVFRLGMLLYLWRVVFYAFSLALIITVLVYFYQEAIRIVGNAVHALPMARAHTFALLAGTLLVKAVGYRLDQLQLVLSPRAQVLFGAGYADVHARLPVLWILIAMCVAGAVATLISIRGRRFLIPGGALAAIVLTSFLGGAMYPSLVQRLVVKPNEFQKQEKYIAYNIEATNLAYGLHRARDEQHVLRNDLTWERLRENWSAIENVRLWDHRPLEQTYQHVQALRPYYRFSDVDVDRYIVDGRLRQVMLAARQLDYSMIPEPKTWVKTHLQYTHGYGICVSPVNVAGPEGLPEFWVKDIPPRSRPEFRINEAGLYYMASLHPRLIEYIAPPEQVPEPAPARPPEMEEVGEQPRRPTRSETARGRRTRDVE